MMITIKSNWADLSIEGLLYNFVSKQKLKACQTNAKLAGWLSFGDYYLSAPKFDLLLPTP